MPVDGSFTVAVVYNSALACGIVEPRTVHFAVVCIVQFASLCCFNRSAPAPRTAGYCDIYGVVPGNSEVIHIKTIVSTKILCDRRIINRPPQFALFEVRKRIYSPTAFYIPKVYMRAA